MTPENNTHADSAPWSVQGWYQSRKFVSALLLSVIGFAAALTTGPLTVPVVLMASSPLLAWIGVEGAADVAGAYRRAR